MQRLGDPTADSVGRPSPMGEMQVLQALATEGAMNHTALEKRACRKEQSDFFGKIGAFELEVPLHIEVFSKYV
jgi:hypothetical protein